MAVGIDSLLIFGVFLPYNRDAGLTLGVIGVDLGDGISGGEPRRRWPRKKRQKHKREQQQLRARSLIRLRIRPFPAGRNGFGCHLFRLTELGASAA